jgi:phosphoglycerate dehydrogenase-like enzyme
MQSNPNTYILLLLCCIACAKYIRQKRVAIGRIFTIAEESIQNIGVIGLGRMGAAIASNILKSGFNVIVYNRTAETLHSVSET